MIKKLGLSIASAVRAIITALTKTNDNLDNEVDSVLQAIGGIENLVHTGACATRLRLELVTTELIDQDALKKQGAFGVIVLDEHSVQIVFGMKANMYSQIIEGKMSQLKLG
ncbi:PTS systemN-acetylglucosamine-specific IIB / IIC component [Vibrio astriarenae]|nr:PTS systemN-acetylglucosamine-specific IIB / IIC component [Vibrio sp. C7]